jgi:hypothetical protein
MDGLNPYTSILSDYFGKEDFAEDYSDSQVRLDFSTASKIQATMAHPMTWALMLCFSLIIFSAIYLKTKKKILLFLIGLIGFNILISGVRTGIAALTIGFLYYLISYKNIKLIILTLVALLVMIVVIQSNDSLSNIFSSFTDVSGQKSDVSGSSISMRSNQLQGAFNEIKGNEWTGKGYGWTGYYMSLYGLHPVVLAFESLIFMVLCNSGFIGVLIWILFFLMLYQLNRKILTLKMDIFLMDTLIIVYAAYSVGTGEYGYMPFFAIFYSFLLGYLVKHEKHETHVTLNNSKINRKNYIRFDYLINNSD